MRRLLACMLALGACLALAGVASAAPKSDNRNVDIVPVQCEGLGSFDVITMEHSATAFRPDGSVLVAKRFAGDSTVTVTTFDGAEFGPFLESFEEGANGKGFQDRLIECTFTEAFTDEFTLDAGTAEFFEIPEEYIGTDITLEGTFNGTAFVIDPGH